MKKGKTAQLKTFKDLKCSYGTVDSKNLKSIYIVIQSWVEPTETFDKWKRFVSSLERELKHLTHNTIDYLIFDKNYILDLNLRSSGIEKGKRSFMNLEITLFLKEHMDFKSPILRDKIKNLVTTLHKYSLSKSKYFTLNKTKQKV